jgi:F-type H+-transporting ATPase subunit b
VQLSWTTFVLETVNFLILLWILKRFLYKPVLESIARRKAAIENSLAQAASKNAVAESLKGQYQNRLEEWEKEKADLRAALTAEMQQQRERLMQDLRKSLDQEGEKQRVLSERRMKELEDRAVWQGTARAVQFATRLLERVAGPELESRLVSIATEDLPALPEERRTAIRDACAGDPPSQILIASAYPLGDACRNSLVQALRKATQVEVVPSFAVDPSLLAGLRMSAGPWIVRANLRDELQYFSEMAANDANH